MTPYSIHLLFSQYSLRSWGSQWWGGDTDTFCIWGTHRQRGRGGEVVMIIKEKQYKYVYTWPPFRVLWNRSAGRPGHVPLGSCRNQGVRHQGGLPGRSGMEVALGSGQVPDGRTALTEVLIPGQAARCQEMKQRACPDPGFQWWGPQGRAGCLRG